MNEYNHNHNTIGRYLNFQNINWNKYNPEKHLNSFPILSTILKTITLPITLVVTLTARLLGVNNPTINKYVDMPASNRDKAAFILSRHDLYSDRERKTLMKNLERETHRNNKDIDQKISKDPFYAYKSIDFETKQPYYLYPYAEKNYEKDKNGNPQFPDLELEDRLCWIKSVLPEIDPNKVSEKNLKELTEKLAKAMDRKLLDSYNYYIEIKNGSLSIPVKRNVAPTVSLYNSKHELVDICPYGESLSRLTEKLKDIDSQKTYNEITNLSLSDYSKLNDSEKAKLPKEFNNFMDKISTLQKDDILPVNKKLSNIARTMSQESSQINLNGNLKFLQNQTINLPKNNAHITINLNNKNIPTFNLYDNKDNLLASSTNKLTAEFMSKLHQYDIGALNKDKQHEKTHEQSRDKAHEKTQTESIQDMIAANTNSTPKDTVNSDIEKNSNEPDIKDKKVNIPKYKSMPIKDLTSLRTDDSEKITDNNINNLDKPRQYNNDERSL